MEQRIGLKEAIGALRQELSEAIMASAQEQLRFEVGQISLEFQVEVERTKDGNGKLKFWVVEFGGKMAQKDVQRHTVKIPLTPRWASNGSPVLTGGNAPQ